MSASPTTTPSHDSTFQRQQQVYQRTWARNLPTAPLQPYLDARPVLTRYSFLPVVDPRKPIEAAMQTYATYSPHTTFNPGNGTAPWSGYAANVNTESELRNQIYALQSCPQAVYVPDSSSDLYQVRWNPNSGGQTAPVQQPFPGLFASPMAGACVDPGANAPDRGGQLFNNVTRARMQE